MAQTGIKFRAHPTSQQKLKLAQWAGCARVIYNQKCAERKAGQPVNQTYAHLKTEEREWLKACPPEILRNSASTFFTAYARYEQGLGGAPRKKKKDNKASILLTRELFDFTKVNGKLRLFIGNQKFPFGELSVEYDREFGIPHQIVLSRRNGHYYVSFTYEVPDGKSEVQIRAALAKLSADELLAQTWGGDRGVQEKLADSEGQFYNFTHQQEKKLATLEQRQKADQKRLARQIRQTKAEAKKEKVEWLPSNSQQQTKRRIAEAHEKAANIRRDFAHQVTAWLVWLPFLLYVLEDLKVKNMTRKPKAKQDANGKWLRNGARAKAGLNRSILASCWGLVGTFLGYKTLRAGKLTIKIAPAYTSQTCSQCGHTAKANRVTRDKFVCQRCGHIEQADTNAAKVIKRKGVLDFLAGKCEPKKRKSITRRTRGCAGGGDVRPVVATAAVGSPLGDQNSIGTRLVLT